LEKENLNSFESEKYSRQLPLITEEGQIRIKKLKISVLGAGGLGQPLLLYLVSSGFENIQFFEPDTVEASNLNRQFFFQKDHIGQRKGEIVRKSLMAVNPSASIVWQNKSLHDQNLEEALQGSALVLETTDNPELKFAVNDFLLRRRIPGFIGGVGRESGHIVPIYPDKACYRCVFREHLQNPFPSLLPPIAGIMGSMMAYLSIAFVMGNHRIFDNAYFLQNGRWFVSAKEFSELCPHHSGRSGSPSPPDGNLQ